jgi:NhaP-type Na+/H+ or K+/H+ antiporter
VVVADLALVAAVLAVVAATRQLISGLPISDPMLFVAAGLVLGPDVLGLFQIELENEAVSLLAELTLATLLFADASRIDIPRLRGSIGIPVRLLGIGLPLTIALTAVLTAALLTPLGWEEAALVAAVLAPTDGEAVVTNQAVPIRIRQALNVESGLNDGLAVPAVTIFLSLAIGAELGRPSELVGDAVAEIGLGVLIGAAAAFALSRVSKWAMSHDWTDAEGYRILTLGGALVAYAGADAAGGNGFISAFMCGLLLRAFMGESVDEHATLVEDAGQIGAAATFVVFGALLVWPAFDVLTPAVALSVIATLTVGRMIPVGIALLGTGLRAPTVAFIGWFGPRGLASMVFGLLIIQEEALIGRADLFAVIVVVIVASVILHGMSASPIAARYGRWYQAHSDSDMEESAAVPRAMVRGERGT